MPVSHKLADAAVVSEKVGRVFQKRLQLAFDRFGKRIAESVEHPPLSPDQWLLEPWHQGVEWLDYSIDLAQRSILFWDTLRQRGDNFLAHEKAGKPPVLHFEYETMLDAREFDRPVNYALVRILPPAGVTVDPARRPYVIIDPRAGHGPGIGGFKDDSQVGVALREGHPVYFVIFFPDPMPGQTLPDVCAAEARFIRRVREWHPNSPKPVIVGNCQGGWAAMMLAAANPDETGPIVINGAPMSYWGGAWREGEGDNPMRYAGGLLGGTWLASFASDLGNGKFDGANLVQNMENLNPANTFWDKYYHLFASVDTEAPRFLEFERWWGGFFLMNREEIDWITQNLFVGNRLWKTGCDQKNLFDLREVKVPIILFASLGDNITPPQQAFNWVADVYQSTEEIKARGQTIVGLLHEDVGHLGIFVSGRVAKKEHTQIVSVLKSIEALPPGLYGMKIIERPGADTKVAYDVEFVEHTLEDMTARLNRFGRADEKPFAAAAMMSEFNQRAYDLFLSPLVQSFSTEPGAKLTQQLHPLRAQRWAWSSLNPWLSWLKPTAEVIQKRRRPAPPEQAFRRLERVSSSLLSASLDYYRDIRDAISEALFFSSYGTMFSLCLADDADRPLMEAAQPPSAPEPEPVREALASILKGGYPEAVARAGALLARKGQALPLSRLQLKKELLADYKDFLPDLSSDLTRRIRGAQDVIVAREPDAAIEAFPILLASADDRERFLLLLERLLADRRIQADGITPEQISMVDRIRQAVHSGNGGGFAAPKRATPPASRAPKQEGARR